MLCLKVCFDSKMRRKVISQFVHVGELKEVLFKLQRCCNYKYSGYDVKSGFAHDRKSNVSKPYSPMF